MKMFNSLVNKSIFLCFVASAFFGMLTSVSFASTTDGTINSTFKYAWSENGGWMNFGTTGGNIHVYDSYLDGYIWSENFGWIDLSPSTSGVVNDEEGNLSGYAWGDNTGWINFSGVTIDSSGVFSGYASGTITGQISMNCANDSACASSDFKVSTDWRPVSARVVVSGTSSSITSGGGGGGGYIDYAGVTAGQISGSTVPNYNYLGSGDIRVNKNLQINSSKGSNVFFLNDSLAHARSGVEVDLKDLKIDVSTVKDGLLTSFVSFNKDLDFDKFAKVSFTVDKCPENGLRVSYKNKSGGEEIVGAYCADKKISFWAKSVTDFVVKEVTGTSVSHFDDTVGHWSYSNIEDLKLRGVVSGKTAKEFDPDASLTRAELVKIALELFDYPIDGVEASEFSDVNVGDWFYDYVGTAKNLGIVDGYADETFAPNQPVLRNEALKILLMASKKNLDVNAVANFQDVDQNEWYAPYVNWAYSKNIVSGYASGKDKGKFGVSNTITRAEIAKIGQLLSIVDTTSIDN